MQHGFSCYINTIIDWIDGCHALECDATSKWFTASLYINKLLDEVIIRDPRFVHRFCTWCDVPYSDSYGNSSSFSSLATCRMPVPKRRYKSSTLFIMFLWIELFCTNYTYFGAFTSTFFDNPKIASLTSFLSFISFMVANCYTETLSESSKNAMCVTGLPCFSMSIIFYNNVHHQ